MLPLHHTLNMVGVVELESTMVSLPTDFKSVAYTSSAIPPYLIMAGVKGFEPLPAESKSDMLTVTLHSYIIPAALQAALANRKDT